MTRRLAARGLLKWRRATHDRRAFALYLTDAGTATLVAALPGVRRAQARIAAALDDNIREDVLNCLRRFIERAVQETIEFMAAHGAHAASLPELGHMGEYGGKSAK